MSIVRWQPRGAMSTFSPFRNVDRFQQEMNQLIDWAFGRGMGDSLVDTAWAPPVDVIQDGDKFRVHVDLPGMKKDEIEITLNGDTLTIRGEKKRESEHKEEDVYRAERYYGSFARSLVLPASVDSTKIEASYRDGVLEVVIPKSEEAKPKQIRIQS